MYIVPTSPCHYIHVYFYLGILPFNNSINTHTSDWLGMYIVATSPCHYIHVYFYLGILPFNNSINTHTSDW